MSLSSWRTYTKTIAATIPALFAEIRSVRQGLRNDHYKKYFRDFRVWCFGVFSYLLLTTVVLYDGLFSYVFPALYRTFLGHQSLLDTAIVLFTILFIIFICGTYWKIHPFFNDFVLFHVFSRWYDPRMYTSPRLLDPVQRQRLRLSQLILLHPSRFTYSFSGNVLVLSIGRKDEVSSVSSSSTQDEEEVSATTENIPLVSALNTQDEEKVLTTDEQITIQSEVLQHDIVLPTEQSDDKANRPTTLSNSIEKKLSPHIRVGQTVSLYLIEETEKRREEIILNSSIYEAIMAYFATQDKGKWVLRNEFLKALYGDDTEKERDAFLDDMRRIRDKINKAAMELLAPQEIPSYILKEINPFKNIVQRGKQSQWRLADSCHIIGLESLARWHQHAKAANAHPRITSPTEGQRIEDLKKASELLIKHYSGHYLRGSGREEDYTGGYLIQYRGEDPFRYWSQNFFKACRDKYISTLEYIAQCEHRVWQQTQEDQWIYSAIELYKECAYAATCDPIDQQAGERNFRACLDMLRHLEDEDALQHLYSVYNTRVTRLISVWTMEQKTRSLLIECGIQPEIEPEWPG